MDYHLGYMAAAYSLIWAVILIYFISLARRERDIWNELRALRDSLHQEDSGPQE